MNVNVISSNKYPNRPIKFLFIDGIFHYIKYGTPITLNKIEIDLILCTTTIFWILSLNINFNSLVHVEGNKGMFKKTLQLKIQKI